jgi:hypothetical protein
VTIATLSANLDIAPAAFHTAALRSGPEFDMAAA